jgi:uracil-DNA glycosylase family 4
MSFLKPPSCSTCIGAGWGLSGFMPAPDGTGSNGVLLLGEALGAQEAKKGRPFVGPAGFQLQSMLERVGLVRHDFLIDNALRCQPPGNKLLNEPYEREVLQSCRSHWAATALRPEVKAILTLGAIPTSMALDLPHREALENHLGYVQWSDRYQRWVVATWHPAFILRGNFKLTGLWLSDVHQALRVAREGFKHRPPKTICDPTPEEFERWVNEYERILDTAVDPGLAYDIETPHSTDKAEDEFELGDPSYQIYRISFAYRAAEGLSVPWSAEYLPGIRRLLGYRKRVRILYVWNGNYDNPRIRANGVEIHGRIVDLMWAWHTLKSDVPKGLGAVVPRLLPHYPRWKHLSGLQPAHYSSVDSAATWDLSGPIIAALEANGLWGYHSRHVIDVQHRLDIVSAGGVRVDDTRRRQVFLVLNERLEGFTQQLQGLIPASLVRFSPAAGYVRDPEVTSGLVRITVEAKVKVCANCGLVGATKTKHTTRKKDNACHGAAILTETRAVDRWAKKLPWTPSNKALQAYALLCKHEPILNEEKKPTFDDDALAVLVRRYPTDPLYPVVALYRKCEKMMGYVGRLVDYVLIEGEGAVGGHWEGGWPVHLDDGRVHTRISPNTSTMRLALQDPNLSQIPNRVKAGEFDYASLLRSIFIAG